MSEPRITINGIELTQAQAMTVRVSLESFAYELHEHGLGNDYHGKLMAEGYLAAIIEIRRLMFCRLTGPEACASDVKYSGGQ